VVVPVVLLVEGVHNGSVGPVFYPLSELRDLPAAWNGRPVTLGHPPAGANTPEALEEFMLGTLFNTSFDEQDRLVSEAWLDVALTRQRAPEILEAAQNGKILEISTGLWFDESGGPGVWNDEAFDTTATNFRPDHLALLPEAVGACSVGDGCGIRNQDDENTKQEVGHMDGLKRALMGWLSNESKPERVAAMMEVWAQNKPGMVSTARALQQHADTLDRDVIDGRLVHWLEEAFDDGTFIMRQNGPDGQKFFRGTFTVDVESSEVAVGEDFTEVMEQRDFVELKENNSEEVEDMSTGTKEVLVASLIACDKTHFDDSHQEALMAMDEDTLNSLKAPEAAKEEDAPATDDTGVVEEAAAASEDTEAGGDLNSYLEQAPEEHQDELKEAVKLNQVRRTEMITAILAVEGCQFNETELKGKSLKELSAIHGLIPRSNEQEEDVGDLGSPMGRPVDFSGRVSGVPEGNEDESEFGAPMGRTMSLAAKKSA